MKLPSFAIRIINRLVKQNTGPCNSSPGLPSPAAPVFPPNRMISEDHREFKTPKLEDYGDLTNIEVRHGGNTMKTPDLAFLRRACISPRDCEMARQGHATEWFCMGPVSVRPRNPRRN